MTAPRAIDVPTDVVTAFAASVRARLGDLTAEERDELAADLEADLRDLVAERGVASLPDAEAYATELRVAGGFTARAPSHQKVPLADHVSVLLDSAHHRWDALVGDLPGHPCELVVALRPTWWVFRAWVALSAVDLVLGGGAYGLGLSVVPSLLGWGWPLLALATLVSVLVGTGRVWPGRGGAWARMTLLTLNLLAIGTAPVALSSVTTAAEVVRWYGL